MLTGERVTLSQLDDRDAAVAWEMVNDVEGNDLTATTEAFTREHIDDWCGSRPEQDERLDLAIIDNKTGQFVGEAVLNDFDTATDSCGFRIALRWPCMVRSGFRRGSDRPDRRARSRHDRTLVDLARSARSQTSRTRRL